jgi:alpha-beta hydrolase superfamily lysophospholipase
VTAPIPAMAPAAAERVLLRTADGLSFPVDWYRPSGTISVGTAVLLPDPADSLAAWAGTARVLAARGFAVFVPEVVLRRAAAPLAVWGRPEDPGAPWIAAWKEVTAVLEHADAAGPGGEPVVLGGTGLGAAAAAVAATHLSRPPAALFLISPAREVAQLPVGPLLAGLGAPALVIVSTDDRTRADAAREIHLAARPTCRLWAIDGYACTPRTLDARLTLAVDLADWIERQLPGRVPRVGEGPRSRGESR